jgi:threonine/homoserine/homoserine lactone efflux protein
LLLFYIGEIYLILFLRKRAKLPQTDHIHESPHNFIPVFTGMLTTVSNLFRYAWWVNMVPETLAKIIDFNFMTIAAFYLGHILLDSF